MKVKEIMSKPVTIDKSERITHALDIMEKHDLRRLLVTNDGKLGGTITMRQIARVLGTRQRLGMPATSLHVASATSDSVVKVDPDMKTEDAVILLQKTSVLVVMDEDEILGWVRPKDMLKALRMSGLAADAMRTPLTASPSDRLIHVRRVMLDRDVGRLPVMENGKLVGIISERDVAKSLRAFRDLVQGGQQEARVKNLLVSDVMSRGVKSTYVDTPLEEARKEMLEEDLGGIPVLNQKNELVGMLTRRCFFDYLAKQK
ncbi:MAG: CBS domain-containing protein [Methanothrix sp.]|jgi:CBS-domain-containing membrane protein|uniref:CBS domain containing membrane protein n=1 Tax=Methanothrix harundinacea TaxID=301375 RepID=A0A101FVK2_9EURY|nr:MAG: CBS domain containing membrane protein [Methanothrix harundinacea]MDD2637409.1 CBS domain-containing protein [Methanothrix sp.]MDI9399588.1 CBS domain-containing protein [Euryarchaeota archaeon]KUK96928.1 MAG: CBS domain containing membrane protein [Methanothrix harundinacea]MCP1392864.1 CBS domain-containing protein [Methanothrix harundinacea]